MLPSLHSLECLLLLKALRKMLPGWGMAVASSRAFKVGKAKQPCMLPLIDLCNHSFTPNCRMETSADGTLRYAGRLQVDKG